MKRSFISHMKGLPQLLLEFNLIFLFKAYFIPWLEIIRNTAVKNKEPGKKDAKHL